jgi:hypothetical protein
MYRRRIEVKKKIRREEAARRSRKNKPATTTTSYEWIDNNSGEYKCRDITIFHQMDFCKEDSRFWYGIHRCKAQVEKVCGGR